jgi:hypothetical protein
MAGILPWEVSGAGCVCTLTTNRETMAVTGHPATYTASALSPDGRRLARPLRLHREAVGHTDGTRSPHARTQLHEHSRWHSARRADLVSVNMDNQFQIWSTRSIRESP